MIKIAIFVEGQTELIFIARLVEETLSRQSRPAIRNQLFGGRNTTILENDTHYVLINDCGGDNSVKGRIRDNYPALVRESYVCVIGLRDLYPLTDAQRLRDSLQEGLPKSGCVFAQIFLAIKEIESWMIAEDRHYLKISSALGKELVNSIAGMDVFSESTEILPHPAQTLHKIYLAAGTSYKKSAWQVQRTVDAIDYEYLRGPVRERIESLDSFLECLDGFLCASEARA
ncbi:MAG: hypothetical protein LBT59_25215 [Clostridiales bacterium]|nr:hypothetical protein [Clostridiales bacterium]